MVKAVHFGAGNIGRGFVGQLYFQSGFELVFLDVVPSLIQALTDAPSYNIITADNDGEETLTVTNYTILHSDQQRPQAVQAIATADIVSCSVGPNILRFIAPVLAEGLRARNTQQFPTPVAVIACENQLNATDALRGFVVEALGPQAANVAKLAEFANCAIDRIVPTQGPNMGVNVKIERHFEWCIDQRPFTVRPDIQGVTWVDDIGPYIDRKLWTVNTGHATTAYFGRSLGANTIREALQIQAVENAVRATLGETGALIQRLYQFTPQQQQQYINVIIHRFENPQLDDSCVRVGRAPLRKLSINERFIRPASMCLENNLPIVNLLRGIERALQFQNVDDVGPDGQPVQDKESYQLRERLSNSTAAEAVTSITGLEANEPLYNQVLPLFQAAKNAL